MTEQKQFDDNSTMPFGKYKTIKMIHVPDDYLIFLKDNASEGCKAAYPEVFDYIKENFDAIKSNAERIKNMKL